MNVRSSATASFVALCSLVGVLALTAIPASAAECLACGPGPGPGPGAGQVQEPVGVAADQSSGDVYVADEENNRIDELEPDGTFIRAFGWGVLNGAEELQTCTSVCQVGLAGPGPGEIKPASVAVDSSSGDVYVTEAGGDYRVQKFTASGEFLLMFGKEVNKTAVADHGSEAEQNACTKSSGDVCGLGVSGTGPGEITNEKAPVTADDSGDAWVGDTNRLEEFGASGAFVKEVKLESAGTIQALAVESNWLTGEVEHLYLISSSVKGVQKIGLEGTAVGAAYPLDASPNPSADETGNPRALALATSGDLFFSDQSTGMPATLLEYDAASGAEKEAFGTGQVIGHPEGNALAVASDGVLYVVSCASGAESALQIWTLPPPEVETTKPTESHKTGGTLNAVVNPEGQEVRYWFQYLTEAAHQKNLQESRPPFTGAVTTTPVGVISEELLIDHHVEFVIPVGQLAPGTVYRFRVVASNECVEGEQCTVYGEGGGTLETESETPVIESETASNVTEHDATLEAEINPGGEATYYHFEYGTSPCEASACGTKTAPEAGPLTGHTASFEVTGLTPNTVYHYWIVVNNAATTGGVHGVPLEFKTPKGAEEIAQEKAEEKAEEKAKAEAEGTAAKKKQEEAAAAAKKQQEEEAGAKKKQEEKAAEATGSVSLDGSTIDIQSSGEAAVKLTCTGTGTCSGKLTLTAKSMTKKGENTETIGTATFSISADKTAIMRLTLNAHGRALLSADHGRLSASLTVLKSSPVPSQTHTENVHLVRERAGDAKR